MWELTNMYKQLVKSHPGAVFVLDLQPLPSLLPLIEGSCYLCPFSSAEGWDIDDMCPQHPSSFVYLFILLIDSSFLSWGSCGSLGCVSACHEYFPPSRCRKWTCSQWRCRLHGTGVSPQTSCIKGQSRGGPYGSDEFCMGEYPTILPMNLFGLGSTIYSY